MCNGKHGHLECSAVKYVVLRNRSKDRLACNQDNVSKWSDMPTHRLLFQ